MPLEVQVNLLLAMLLTSFCFAAPLPELADAKESIKSLIAPILGSKKRPKGTEKFHIEGCDKFNVDWMEVLTLKKEFSLNYKYKDLCDIQGTITPKLLSPFPASLDLRNLMSFTHLDSQNKITSTFESKPILNLEMREGKLTGKKGKVRFEADYQVRINPLNREDPVEENLGGEIRIKEIYGVKASIKEKIKVE